MALEMGSDFGKDDDIIFKYRPRGVTETIPQNVYEARMSLLSDEDRYFLEEAFKKDDRHLDTFRFFGGLVNRNESYKRNAIGFAVRCAEIGRDEGMAVRIFKASGFGDNIKAEYLAPMIHEAFEFNEKFSAKTNEMHQRIIDDCSPATDATSEK